MRNPAGSHARRWTDNINGPRLQRDAGGSRTHFDRVATGCLAVWLQRLVEKCSRQESNLVLDLRRVACESTILREQIESTPPRNRTSSCGSEDRRASTTLEGLTDQVSRPGFEPRARAPTGAAGWSLRRVQCDPLHHRDVLNTKSRRLDSHQHQPVYKTGAFLSRATSAIKSRSARSRTLLGGFGGRLLPRSTLL